jgi:hypothetical protein
MPRSRPDDCDNVVILRSRSKVRRRFPGLTIEETIEFEALDAQPLFDCNGEVAWVFEGHPINQREKRWLELFEKLGK